MQSNLASTQENVELGEEQVWKKMGFQKRFIQSGQTGHFKMALKDSSEYWWLQLIDITLLFMLCLLLNETC